MARGSWHFHGVDVRGTCAADALWRCWTRIFAGLPAARAVAITLDGRAGPVPETALTAEPSVVVGTQHFWREETTLHMHIPGVAMIGMDLPAATSTFWVAPAYQTHEPLVEDLLAVALAPHLRRQGRYLLHAFGAAWEGQGVLLVGDSGAGKTTSGLALLAAGWQLLGNDVVQFDAEGGLHGYPGRVAATLPSLARFAATAPLHGPLSAGKLRFPAEAVWPGCRRAHAVPAQILFPRIVDQARCTLRPLTPAEALGRLLPHTLDRWDAALLGDHLAAAEVLVRRAPAAELLLGRHMDDLPGLLRSGSA